MQGPLKLVYENDVVTLVDQDRATPAVVTRVVQQYRGPLTALDMRAEGEAGSRTNVPSESGRGQSRTYWRFVPVVVIPDAPVVEAAVVVPEPVEAPPVVDVPAVAPTVAETAAEDATIRAELAAGIAAIPDAPKKPRRHR